MCGHKCLISEFLTFKMWSGNVVFGWHGNTCSVFFYWCDFYMIYIVQVKSMCVPILRSIGSELTKLENMRQLYVLFDVAWRKNRTSYVMDTTTLPIGILTRNILKPTRSLYDFRFKSYGSNIIVVFVFSVILTLTLTFDLCSIFLDYIISFLSHLFNYQIYSLSC